MNVSSAPASPAVPTAAASPGAASGGKDSAPAGPFDALLPQHRGGAQGKQDQKSQGKSAQNPPQNKKDTEEDPTKAPSQAIQMNLAALLYSAGPITPLPTMTTAVATSGTAATTDPSATATATLTGAAAATVLPPALASLTLPDLGTGAIPSFASVLPTAGQGEANPSPAVPNPLLPQQPQVSSTIGLPVPQMAAQPTATVPPQFQVPTLPTLPTLPATAMAANSLSTAPAPTVQSPVVAAQSPIPTPISSANQAIAAMPAPVTSPAVPAAPVAVNAPDLSTVVAAQPAVPSAVASPAVATPATDQMATVPAAPDTTVTTTVDPAVTTATAATAAAVPAETASSTPAPATASDAANFPQVTADSLPTPTAISSAATGAAPMPAEISINSQPAEKADVSLIGGHLGGGKKAHGTAGAKGEKDMTTAPTKTSSASSRGTASRTLGTAAGKDEETATAKEAKPGQVEEHLADEQSGENSHSSNQNHGDNSQASPTTFSLPTDRTASSSSATTTVETASTKNIASGSLVDEVGMGLEKIQQTGSNKVELHLNLEGGAKVEVQLQLKDGTVHASFNTSSPDLREALQQGWSQLSNRSENLGMQLADPTFKSPSDSSHNSNSNNSSMANAGQQDSRERRQGSQASSEGDTRYANDFQDKRPGTNGRSARTSRAGLNEWA